MLLKTLFLSTLALLFLGCEEKQNNENKQITPKKEIVVAKAKKTPEEKPQQTKSSIELKTCQGCHGTNFEKHALGKSKIVANMTKKEVSDALLGYKKGTYGGELQGLMKYQVSKYSEEVLGNTGIGK